MIKQCRRCGKRMLTKSKYKEYCRDCYKWIHKRDKKRLKEYYKEARKTRIILRLEKKGRYVEKRIPHEMLHALFDLQYMMDESDWDTLKLNKMEKGIVDFFKIVDYMSDAEGDGRCYKWDYDKHGWVETGHKYYHSGRKPRWKKLK